MHHCLITLNIALLEPSHFEALNWRVRIIRMDSYLETSSPHQNFPSHISAKRRKKKEKKPLHLHYPHDWHVFRELHELGASLTRYWCPFGSSLHVYGRARTCLCVFQCRPFSKFSHILAHSHTYTCRTYWWPPRCAMDIIWEMPWIWRMMHKYFKF